MNLWRAAFACAHAAAHAASRIDRSNHERNAWRGCVLAPKRRASRAARTRAHPQIIAQRALFAGRRLRIGLGGAAQRRAPLSRRFIYAPRYDNHRTRAISGQSGALTQLMRNSKRV